MPGRCPVGKVPSIHCFFIYIGAIVKHKKMQIYHPKKDVKMLKFESAKLSIEYIYQ